MTRWKLVERDKWTYYPTHGDVEWVEMLGQRLAEEEETFPTAMWCVDMEDDSNSFQLTQENTFVFLSRADDVHDLIEVMRPDGYIWGWFRENVGADGFNQLLRTLQNNCCGTVVLTMFPGKGTVDKYDAMSMQDLGDYLPEGW